MLTPQSPSQLRAEAKAHLAEFKRLRGRADAVFTSGAPSNYSDVLDYYQELCEDADRHHVRAMGLYRMAHAVEHFDRDRRAA